MKKPIFVRSLTDAERRVLQTGLHSSNAIIQRRCQILLASASGEHVPYIAKLVGCDGQTIRNIIHAFNTSGLDTLRPRSSRPHTIHPAFPSERWGTLLAILDRTPRDFNKPNDFWTLELVAEVSFELGLTPTRVSCETVRATLARIGITNWKGIRWRLHWEQGRELETKREWRRFRDRFRSE